MDVRDDLDSLVNVVEDDDGLSEHEEGFWQSRKGVGKGCSGFGDGLEVVDRVVSDESDCSPWLSARSRCTIKAAHL